MRSISFALTKRQFLDGSKDVTRRLGWASLKPGTRLRAVEKAMGLKKGEHPVVLGEIEVVSVRRERLAAITPADVRREGFPDMGPTSFVEMFCAHMGCTYGDEVTRIEFRRVPAPPAGSGRAKGGNDGC